MKIVVFAIGFFSFVLAFGIIIKSIGYVLEDNDEGWSGIFGGALFLICSIFTMILSPSFNPSDKNTLYEISITAEDGRIICNYEDTSNIALDRAHREIKFEDKDHHKQIIVYGTQDTVTIIEN